MCSTTFSPRLAQVAPRPLHPGFDSSFPGRDSGFQLDSGPPSTSTPVGYRPPASAAAAVSAPFVRPMASSWEDFSVPRVMALPAENTEVDLKPTFEI